MLLHVVLLNNVSIMVMRNFLYLLHLRSSLDLGLFMSYLCDLFFHFRFAYFSKYALLFFDDNVNGEFELF